MFITPSRILCFLLVLRIAEIYAFRDPDLIPREEQEELERVDDYVDVWAARADYTPLNQRVIPPARMSEAQAYESVNQMVQAIPLLAPSSCKDTDSCCQLIMAPIQRFLVWALAINEEAMSTSSWEEWQSAVPRQADYWNERGYGPMAIPFRCRHIVVVPHSVEGFRDTEGYNPQGAPYTIQKRFIKKKFVLLCVRPEVLSLLDVRRRFSHDYDTIGLCINRSRSYQHMFTRIKVSGFYHPNVNHALDELVHLDASGHIVSSYPPVPVNQGQTPPSSTLALSLKVLTSIVSIATVLQPIIKPIKCVDWSVGAGSILFRYP